MVTKVNDHVAINDDNDKIEFKEHSMYCLNRN